MISFRHAALACALSLSFATGAQAIEAGTYKGQAEYGGDLVLVVKKNSAFIEVKADGCQGDTEAQLKKVSASHWQMRPDWPGCVIDFRQKGNRITVKEGSDCFQLHGAMCSFDGTVTGGGQKSAGTSEPPPAPVISDTWTYGEDPELGLTAHIRTTEGAVGLACVSDGSNPATVEILGFRATNGLIAPNGTMFMFMDRDTGVSLNKGEGKAYGERRDTTCGVSLSDIRSASKMVLIDGTIAAVDASGARLQMTIAHEGGPTVVFDANDAAEKIGGRSISLKGSSAAIKQLLRECPAAQQDIEWNCGL